MKQENKNSFRKKYYLIYSGVFLFCAFCITFYLFIHGKTNINYVNDGMNQHFRGMVYFSQYLKDYFGGLFSGDSLVPEMWDFSIGEGSDILTTLHSYSFADPLCLLNVLIPARYIYIAYLFNSFLRLYLAGLFFSELCFYLKVENRTGILSGALAYAFCFWGLKNFTMHLSFLVPLMYLPLLILGTEMVINDDKPYVFIAAVTLSCATFFYFFYMEVLATAIYGICRLVAKYKTDFSGMTKKLVMIIAYGVLGVAMAAIILLPVLHSYLGDSRRGFKNWLGLVYPPFFYERLFTIFLSNDSPYDLCMGFVSPALLFLVLTFKDFKKNGLLCLFNLLCFVCVCFPVFGKIFNGFAYVSQRWSFVIALPICFNIAYKWNDVEKNKKLLLFSLLGFILLALYSSWSRNERVLFPVLLCIAFYFAYVFMPKGGRYIRIKDAVLLAIILVNILYIFEFNLSPRGGDTLSDLMNIEDARNIETISEAYVMKNYMKEEPFYRYAGNNLTNNASMTHDAHSTNFYFSITNPADQAFRMDLGMRDTFNIQIAGYDDRSTLESLANAKYHISKKDYNGLIPFGFEPESVIDDYKIYKNEFVLPFGYTYKDCIALNDWLSLDMIERQEIMLDAVVLEDEQTTANKKPELKEIPFEVECSEDAQFSNDEILIKEKNAYITLKINGTTEEENYISFVGFKHHDIYNVVEDDVTNSVVRVSLGDEDVISSFLLKTNMHRYDYGKGDFVCYLGYPKEAIKEVRVYFSLPGSYSYESIKIESVPVDKKEEKIEQLSENCLKNVVFSKNAVVGEIDMNSDGYLLFSTPYSKGWKAYIDGERSTVLKGNIHYMAVKLEKGHHVVEMRYSTPGFVLGVAVSTVSIALYIAIICSKRKKAEFSK